MLAALLSLVSSCGSSSKEKEVRTFDKDYKVVDASEKSIPDWIDTPEKGESESKAKGNRYFVNESANIQKRLCIKSAEARATSRIASEIAQFMKNSYAEATQDGEDEVTSYMQEQLAQEAQSFIVGASVVSTYWEKRAYKEDMGADANKTEYNCFALVRMSKKNLEKAVNKSRAKLVDGLEDPEVKKKTNTALEDVASKFSSLDKKVELTEE